MITEKNLALLTENVADAKQKLLHKDIVNKLRELGWEPVNAGSDKKFNWDTNESEAYNYVQFRPINRRYIKGSEEERVELNLRTGKCKLMAMMRNQPEYDEPKTYKFDLPADVKKLGAQLRHSMQANFRSAGKAWEGGIDTPTKNRTEEMLKAAGEKGAESPALKKVLGDLNNKRRELANKYKVAKENGASKEELDKIGKEMSEVINKSTRYGGLFSKNDNIYRTMMKNGLKHDAEVDKRIALANSGKKASVVTEGSHHAKYSPAINYKNVNNYIIKARKALKAGNYDEAEKWAWEAQETIHEDEMQGPGVAADKNAYNIYKKQVMNIYDAVRKAKGNK